MAAAAGAATYAGNALIVAGFPDRPAPRDLLFELVPYYAPVRYVTAAALIAALTLFAFHVLTRAREDLPRIVTVVSLMYLLRAAIMVLTPLASAQGEGPFVFSVVQYGMFPSGHAAVTWLCARLTDPARAPRLRAWLYVLAVVEWVTLVAAHGHYSIDVVGGVLLAYFVDREWQSGRLFGPLKRALG